MENRKRIGLVHVNNSFLDSKRHINGHILYENEDTNAPDSIKDRNGEVYLGMCKLCGAVEIELFKKCTKKG